jgi:hypothetical protein
MTEAMAMNAQTRLHRVSAARSPKIASKTAMPGSKAAIHDPRWPVVAAALATLREDGRHAVRIVDADCGAGSLLLQAVHHARTLGFTAIEGRGIDGSPALIGRARAAASRCTNLAIGTTFEVADMVTAMLEEHDLPADLVICHGMAKGRRPEVASALENAARIVIGDDVTWHAVGTEA